MNQGFDISKIRAGQKSTFCRFGTFKNNRFLVVFPCKTPKKAPKIFARFARIFSGFSYFQNFSSKCLKKGFDIFWNLSKCFESGFYRGGGFKALAPEETGYTPLPRIRNENKEFVDCEKLGGSRLNPWIFPKTTWCPLNFRKNQNGIRALEVDRQSNWKLPHNLEIAKASFPPT